MVVHCAGRGRPRWFNPGTHRRTAAPARQLTSRRAVAERLRDALSEGLAGYGYGSAGIGGGGHEGEKPYGLAVGLRDSRSAPNFVMLVARFDQFRVVRGRDDCAAVGGKLR